jgi:ferrous iron transport protein B
LGFGDWRCTTALITGFLAKESVVSTLTILYGSTAVFSQTMSAAAAAALLVFCLLYTPCVAAIAAIRQELGTRKAILTVLFQCAVAWVCALIIHGVGLLMV